MNEKDIQRQSNEMLEKVCQKADCLEQSLNGALQAFHDLVALYRSDPKTEEGHPEKMEVLLNIMAATKGWMTEDGTTLEQDEILEKVWGVFLKGEPVRYKAIIEMEDGRKFYHTESGDIVDALYPSQVTEKYCGAGAFLAANRGQQFFVKSTRSPVENIL